MPTEDTEGARILAPRLVTVTLAGLAERLAALDQDRGRRAQTPGPTFDAPECEGILERLQAYAEYVGPSAPAVLADAISRRADALRSLLEETGLKLAGERSREVLAQGLRRLAAALEPLPAKPDEAALPPEVCRTLGSFDACFDSAQWWAQEMLSKHLALEMMPDQTGLPLDPLRHNITASVSGDDPSRDNTVASQEASGWLLEGEVLVPADVTRLTCPAAAAPALPSLEELPSHTIDPDLLGRKEAPPGGA